MKIELNVAQLLTNQKKTLAVAESCTGGLLADTLTNIPGSSDYFQLGIITYSNEAKQKLLKIPARTLKQYGAVSEQVASDMAQGVRTILKTDFGLGLTGIAGPTGGTKNKPVGLVFMAISTSSKTHCLRCQFQGTRTNIKKQAAHQALKLLKQQLI